MALILDDIPALPLALAGPLTQVLDVMSGMINAVNTMRETKDGCARLIYRVLRFLQSLVVELRTIKATVPDDTPTAARLFALKRCVFLYACPNLVYIDVSPSGVAT